MNRAVRISFKGFSELQSPDKQLLKELLKLYRYWSEENNIEHIPNRAFTFTNTYDAIRFLQFLFVEGYYQSYKDVLKLYMFLDSSNPDGVILPWHIYVDKSRGICEKISWQKNGIGKTMSINIVFPFNETTPCEVWLNDNKTIIRGKEIMSIYNNWRPSEHRGGNLEREEEIRNLIEAVRFRGYNTVQRFLVE